MNQIALLIALSATTGLFDQGAATCAGGNCGGTAYAASTACAGGNCAAAPAYYHAYNSSASSQAPQAAAPVAAQPPMVAAPTQAVAPQAAAPAQVAAPAPAYDSSAAYAPAAYGGCPNGTCYRR